MVAYEGNEPYVFISYAHKDKEQVLPIIQGLQDRGFRVWYDEGIEVGSEWPDFIAEHLERCACVLTFVSRNFGESHNCRQEFTFSQNLHKDNSVVYLEDPEVLRAGLRMQLVNLQALYYKKFDTLEKLLNELSAAKVLSLCLGEAAASGKAPAVAPMKPAEPAAEKQPKQTTSIDKKREIVNKTLSDLAVEKYGKDVTVASASSAATEPNDTAEPSAEELRKQGNVYILRKETEKGIALLRKAADKGNANAQYNLGSIYFLGKVVPKDVVEAAKWFKKAAEQGHRGAQYTLGLVFSSGKGVPMNQVEAAKWYGKAAEQGDIFAYVEMGDRYCDGIGVTKNYEEAVKWYRRAAERHHGRALEMLGHCYEFGKGVPQDYEEALEWYQEAASRGSSSAAKKACELSKMLGHDDF